MTSTFEFCIDPCIYDHLGKFSTYHTSSECEYITIIMCS